MFTNNFFFVRDPIWAEQLLREVGATAPHVILPILRKVAAIALHAILNQTPFSIITKGGYRVDAKRAAVY